MSGRHFVFAVSISLFLVTSCEPARTNASASDQPKSTESTGFALESFEPAQLKDSVDVSEVEGVAGAPSPEGGSTNMDAYVWDASGNRELLQLTKTPSKGVIQDIFYTKNHVIFQLSSSVPVA